MTSQLLKVALEYHPGHGLSQDFKNACPNKRFSGNYLSKRQVGRVLAKSLPRGIEMVSVCTGLLGEEGRVSASVDTRL